MPSHEEGLDPGFFTRSLKNPWISVPFSLASGFGAGATRGTARTTAGVHDAVRLILAGEKANYELEKEKRLSEVLGRFGLEDQITKEPTHRSRDVAPLTGAQRTMLSNIPGDVYQKMTSAEIEEKLSPGSTMASSVPAAPAPAQVGREHIPLGVRQYLRAVAPYDPEGASKLLGTYLMREPTSTFAKPPTPTPKDYTAQSIRAWRQTVTPKNPQGDFSLLVPRETGGPFAKPPVPTTRDYKPESIREWRKTRTAENPQGDSSVLVPREKPEKISPRDAAFQRLSREEQRQVILREGNPDRPLTANERQNVLGQIIGEARRQVEGQFRGTLGQIDISALGKTPGERGAKFREMIRNTAREIAEERGIDLDELRSPGGKAKKILGTARAKKIFQDAQGDPHIATQIAKEQGFTHDEEGNPL